MTVSVLFLHSLAQSIATISLYGRGHPARGKTVDASFAMLDELHRLPRAAQFSFLGENVVHDQTPIPSLRGWQWASRLSDAGVQRLEFTPDLTRDGFERFLESLYVRLGQVAAAADTPPPGEPVAGVRFGAVSMYEASPDPIEPGDAATSNVAAYSLAEETAVTRWIFANAEKRGKVPASEAELIVRSLLVLRHADAAPVIPILRLANFGDYAVMHAINVASLTLALAEQLGAGRREALRIGVAGLLHDIGMASVPRALLEKNQLTPDERERIHRHPREGAQLLLTSGNTLDLAAIAAYEHHFRPDGTGYPTPTAPRRPHVVSSIVKVCSVFTALRSFRVHWPAWSLARGLRYIESGAGVEFEPAVAAAFVRMLRRGRDRQISVTEHPDDMPDFALLDAGDESPAGDRGVLA